MSIFFLESTWGLVSHADLTITQLIKNIPKLTRWIKVSSSTVAIS